MDIEKYLLTEKKKSWIDNLSDKQIGALAGWDDPKPNPNWWSTKERREVMKALSKYNIKPNPAEPDVSFEIIYNDYQIYLDKNKGTYEVYDIYKSKTVLKNKNLKQFITKVKQYLK
jgi:cytolysin (calcineurin-like family phosphatase)